MYKNILWTGKQVISGVKILTIDKSSCLDIDYAIVIIGNLKTG